MVILLCKFQLFSRKYFTLVITEIIKKRIIYFKEQQNFLASQMKKKQQNYSGSEQQEFVLYSNDIVERSRENSLKLIIEKRLPTKQNCDKEGKSIPILLKILQ